MNMSARKSRPLSNSKFSSVISSHVDTVGDELFLLERFGS